MDSATQILAQDPCSISNTIADNDKVLILGRITFVRDLYILSS